MAEQVVFQNDPVDPSAEFRKQQNHFFVAGAASDVDPQTGRGELRWERRALEQRVSYHQVTLQLADLRLWRDMPEAEYREEQSFPFDVAFLGARALRLRVAARPALGRRDSPMLERCEPGRVWEHDDDGACCTWRGRHGAVIVRREPWTVELRDARGRLLTRTNHHSESPGVVNTNPMPFSHVRSSASFQRHIAASFALSPGERLYGCGESFTRLDKRGQRLCLWTRDAYSAQTPAQYKPVPFFISSRGYGVFVHTSAPVTFDLGHDYDGASVLYLGEDVLDLFFFLGEPADVLSEYTAVTGRSAMPPLWSFGLWMGRDTYESADEVREVAARLRRERIPCDVLHVDTGWTERKYGADFTFSRSRFPDPAGLSDKLRAQGFRLSLWQFPYLHPNDPLHTEAIDSRLVIVSSNGKPPVDDAVIDLTNDEAVRWYQARLARVLRDGASVFTSDFGEAAPFGAVYRTDPSGFDEHNLYPLRYNRAVAEVTEEVTGHRLQHARAAWAGSQRYPLHFAGDGEVADSGMLGTLRGGLSLGLCGFTFWTHFIGGFPKAPDPDLYLRWLAFGVLSSHARCHGAPPREPWEFGREFLARFRRIVELRYALIPYLLEHGRTACERGHPLVRPLFFEHPHDPGSWLVDDQYLLGPDLLVGPMFESASNRLVYLPPGRWLGFFDGAVHEGPGWTTIAPAEIPAVLLVRDGARVPLARPAQHTGELDLDGVEEWRPPGRP
jgi:alpha-D-xyloside xylohydrolase